MRTMTKPIFILALFVAATSGLFAQNVSEIQQRIKERLPKVDELKLSQKVGENNKGYLEARASLSPSEQKILAEVNADRKTLYGIAAKRAGSSADQVGKQRAATVRERSPKGIWIQEADGTWKKK